MGFLIADVSGKGISAAFIMAEVKGIFESLAKIITSPRELLIKVNEILNDSIDRKNFVTSIYGILDTLSGTLKFARAGHPPIFYFSNGLIKRLIPDGIGLGLDYSDKFSNSIKEMEIKLNNDDILVLYTDGINEAQNSKLENFGYERMEELISKHAGDTTDEISNCFMKDVSLFSKDQAQHDDITLIILKWNFNNKSVGES